MRKALLVTMCAVALLMLALPAFAAEKVDNVFIAGVGAGFYGSTGYMGENYDPGVGINLFFGYGITEYFSMELDFTPMIMTSPSGDDVTTTAAGLPPKQDTAVWGGFSNGGFGGWGISGRLYPRKAFREADFKIVQPYLQMGFTYMNFMYEYASADAVTGYEYDGFTSIFLDFGFGIDFFIVDFVSLGPALGIHKPFVMGDTLQGDSMSSDAKADVEGSLMWNGSVVLKFQW